MKKVFLLTILIGPIITFASNVAYYSHPNNEIIVISEYLSIFKNEDSNAKELRKVKLLDKLYSLGKEIINNRVFIESKDGIKGWVEVNKTNLLTKEWKSAENFQNMVIFYPEHMGFLFREGGRWEKQEALIYGGLILDQKLYNDKYFILSHHIISNYNDFIKSMKAHKSHEYNKRIELKYIDFNNLKSYYQEGVSREGKKFFRLIIDGGEKTYSLSVQLQNRNYNEEDELYAKKILFSVRLR